MRQRKASLSFLLLRFFKGDLILSDELNHVSLILGMRLSGAYCQTFAHNGGSSVANRVETKLVSFRYERFGGEDPRGNRPRTSAYESTVEKDHHRGRRRLQVTFTMRLNFHESLVSAWKVQSVVCLS